MTEVLKFLEDLGRRPDLTPAGYDAAVIALDAEPAQQQALLGRDADALGRLLGARVRMICAVAAPGEEELEEAPGEPAQAPDQTPDEEEIDR